MKYQLLNQQIRALIVKAPRLNYLVVPLRVDQILNMLGPALMDIVQVIKTQQMR